MQAELTGEGFLDKMGRGLRLQAGRDLARWRGLCEHRAETGVFQALGKSQGSQLLRREEAGSQSLPHRPWRRKGAGRAVHLTLLPQHPQNRLLLPMELCWACLMVKLVAGEWGDILFKWACLSLNLFSRTSFSRAGGQFGEAFLPKRFSPSPAAQPLLRVREGITWRRHLPPLL